MKKIRCLLPLLLLALFTGCTLMIDEPETATTPQETENGDGITSPRRIVSDMGEVRYQIGPETRMIDKDYLPYLLTYKTDTLDRVTEIYFNKSVPLELLPQRGEFLATDQTDAIPNGLAHQVNLVRTTDNGYTVEVSPASYDDVYKTLDIVTDFDIVRVPVEKSNAYGFWKVAGDEPEYEYKLRGTYLNPLAKAGPYCADEPIDERFSLAFVGVKLTRGQYSKMYSKYKEKDPYWNFDPFGGKTSYNLLLGGDMDAYAGLELFMHFHADVRKEEKYADVWNSLEYELKAGFGGERAELGVTLPIMGNKSWATSMWKLNYLKSKAPNPFAKINQVNSEDFWIPFKFPKQPFLLGGIPCSVGLDGAFMVDIYGYLQMDNPYIMEAGLKGTLLKQGFHTDPKNGWSIYPFPGSPSTSHFEPYAISQCDSELKSLGLGFRASVNLGLAFWAGEILKLSIGPTVKCPVEYGIDLSAPKELYIGRIKDNKGKTLGYAGNSGLSIEPSVTVSFDATLDAKIWEIPLVHVEPEKEWKLPGDYHRRWNPKLYVYQLYPNPNMSNADSTQFSAIVKTDEAQYLHTPNEVPMLYIYKEGEETGICVKPRGNTNEAFKPTAYCYDFFLPKGVDESAYYAVPVLEGKYHDPFRFTYSGTTLSIYNLEQVRVEGRADWLRDDEEAVAVRMDINGKIMEDCKNAQIKVHVEDENGNITTDQYTVGNPGFAEETRRKLLFIFAHTKDSRPVEATFELSYIDYSKREQHELDIKAIKFKDPNTCKLVVDLENMEEWNDHWQF